MFGLRLPELLIIFVVLVLLFGAKKLPQLGDSLGKGIRAFKKAADHGFADDDKGTASEAQGQLDASARTSPATPASVDAEKANRKGDPPA
jgi:sec-independent protein translocase protein TatA